ncbi:MAG: glutamate racemase [Candidatus Sericytochromatia bacterium]|nr:glutamate racemase [Candidatus Sericytochromatia bacterium]
MSNRPIALYDSGVGGLSVLQAVSRRLPNEALLYVGDNARVPYGGRPTEQIIDFNREIIDFCVAQGAKIIVAACNTSSALALPQLRSQSPVPHYGTVNVGARQAEPFKRVAILATEATVRSHAYRDALVAGNRWTEVMELACPTFVPMVEQGEVEGDHAYDVVSAAVAPLLAFAPEAVILGCTHYPHLRPLIQLALGPRVQLIDPAMQVADDVANFLETCGLLSTQADPSRRFFTSGSPQQFRGLAEQFLGESVGLVWPTTLEVLPLATTA